MPAYFESQKDGGYVHSHFMIHNNEIYNVTNDGVTLNPRSTVIRGMKPDTKYCIHLVSVSMDADNRERIDKILKFDTKTKPKVIFNYELAIYDAKMELDPVSTKTEGEPCVYVVNKSSNTRDLYVTISDLGPIENTTNTEEKEMKPEMKEKMKDARKLCSYVFNPTCGAAVRSKVCSVGSNYNLALRDGHDYLAHVKFYNHEKLMKEDICEFRNIELYPKESIIFTLTLDGPTKHIDINIGPGTKEYSILAVEPSKDLDVIVDIYDCTKKPESKEDTPEKDEEPKFVAAKDEHLQDKEYQAALMAELFKQRLSSLGLSIVDKDGSKVDVDDCLSTDEPWKTFQTTGVHYMRDGSLDAYGIYGVGDEGVTDINDRIRKMICDIKYVERQVKRIRSENESLINKIGELKTTTTYPHVLDINNHCINTTDDIMVRVELREKVSHITASVGVLYFRKDDPHGYRMIFGEDGQYEMKVIDTDFLKEHPMVPGLHSLYVDTDQIPKQMRENLEMVVSELVDRHIQSYTTDFIEYLNVIQGWLREAHKNLKGSKRARKQVIKALKD